MKKTFREKLVDNGFSQDQAEKIEKLVLEEMDQEKVSGGQEGDGICFCPYCNRWISERYWEDHSYRCEEDYKRKKREWEEFVMGTNNPNPNSSTSTDNKK